MLDQLPATIAREFARLDAVMVRPSEDAAGAMAEAFHTEGAQAPLALAV